MKSYTSDCKYQRLLVFHQKITSEQHRFFVHRIRSRKKIKKKKMTSIFFTSKFCKKSTSSVETTLIFLPWKLRQRKYVKTTSIFHPSKLYRKGTSKWRGNSEIFTFQYIDVFQSTLTCACWMVSHTISGHQKQLST